MIIHYKTAYSYVRWLCHSENIEPLSNSEINLSIRFFLLKLVWRYSIQITDEWH